MFNIGVYPFCGGEPRMSVSNFQRRQTDADQSGEIKGNRNQFGTDVERPLSEYDNIASSALTGQTHFPLGDIRFRFDDSPLTTNIMNNTSNSSAVHYNNDDKQTTTLPAHQYENVLETLQMRNNQRESDQQVKSNQDDQNSPQHRSVMSVAKSSFFGLGGQSTTEDEFDRLIEDIGNATIITSDRNEYVNVPPNQPSTDELKVQLNQDKVSATSSASGSSSTTVTPSSSPTRQDREENSRKNSEGSNRSKSPKFMLPESTPSSPSQTVYMSTTVPQNIKGQNIMGRHKPTRHSLRHSRMIVTSKHFQGPSIANSLNIRHIWLAKFVLVLKIITGTSLVALGGWICLFANSTPIQQNPFWSGLIIIISGLLGLYLLTFKRTRSKLKANFFWFLKMNASVIIVMSVFLTTLALIYASFHYISLTSDNKKCFPENVFINSSSCICIFNVKPGAVVSRESIETNADSSGHIDLPDGGNVVHFRDLSCNELATWTHILLTSMILNFVGLLLAVCYMTQFIFGCKRRRKKSFASVRNNV